MVFPVPKEGKFSKTVLALMAAYETGVKKQVWLIVKPHKIVTRSIQMHGTTREALPHLLLIRAFS